MILRPADYQPCATAQQPRVKNEKLVVWYVVVGDYFSGIIEWTQRWYIDLKFPNFK